MEEKMEKIVQYLRRMKRAAAEIQKIEPGFKWSYNLPPIGEEFKSPEKKS